jgi:hypothetical protein
VQVIRLGWIGRRGVNVVSLSRPGKLLKLLVN